MFSRRLRVVAVAASGLVLAVSLGAWVVASYEEKRPHEEDSSDAGDTDTSVGESCDEGYNRSSAAKKGGEDKEKGVEKDGAVDGRGVPTRETQRTEQLFLEACGNGDEKTVRQLLQTRGANVNARYGLGDHKGRTALIHATALNRTGIVELLIANGADVNATDPVTGCTALHNAKTYLLHILLDASSDPNIGDVFGDTPLHQAVEFQKSRKVDLLLVHGAVVDVVNKAGLAPIHFLLQVTSGMSRRGVDIPACYDIAQALVSRGATWDDTCDELIDDESMLQGGFRVALQWWMEEHSRGIQTLTDIPEEMLKRGPGSVMQYVSVLRVSAKTILRRKVCVVGPSFWGKTSFVQSISAGKSVLEHSEDRTIGIDQCVMLFSEKVLSDDAPAYRDHKVTFWNIADPEAYQVARLAISSKNNLYLICVDLHAFAVALEQTELRGNKERDMERLMGEFVGSKILRWIRLIVAREPDAEFVFVGTKADVLEQSSHRIMSAHRELWKRVNEFAEIIEDKSVDLNERLGRRYLGVASSSTSGSHDNPRRQPLSDSVNRLRQMKWLVVNCKDEDSIHTARKVVEQIITKSKRSYQMPNLYSQVLDVIMERQELHRKQWSSQVKVMIQTTANVSSILRRELKKSKDNLSDTGCKAVLRTLHDNGDVFWFEDLGIEYFKDRVILHPPLVIDFVRQFVHHNCNTGIMTHTALDNRPFWDDLDPELMLAMKQLLQQLKFVRPAGSKMKRDSDLIVSTFWRSREGALWLFNGDLLVNEPSLKEMKKDYCVQWEYHFTTALPDAIFSELAIESYTSRYKRHAGPEWILYEVEDEFACRAVVTRAPRTLQRVLRLEAIASKTAPTFAWGRFEHLCESLERVLSQYRGLIVSRFVVDDKGTSRELDEIVDKRMRLRESRREPKRWLPPSLDWYYENVMKARVKN